ncbi:hypothetical protein BG20_I2158 [Candidatus Nitrosarchaeum limnium BG20]|uniref:Uncharacterized protein n=1 Tax=Candidatus Nitrosarchaeum limnium BG20 TaxID=859192 RepID=S2E1B4_9ARCH|nr:hypothetical protein BG20_I2158 [Candidatus Nitrosarchaeum limnium BG20]
MPFISHCRLILLLIKDKRAICKGTGTIALLEPTPNKPKILLSLD